jgi:TatA/E family protein of Tat protein translocase
MFGSIGGPELILIFLVALLIFGPRKLPELGRMVGKGLGEFRRAANDLRVSLETEVAREAPARGGENGALVPISAAPGSASRTGHPQEVAASAAENVETVPAGTDVTHPEGSPNPRTAPDATGHPAPAAAPDARDADRSR